MVFDGGYGATVHVRESLLNDVVGAVHFALGDQLSTTTSGAISVGGRRSNIREVCIWTGR